MMIKRDTYAFGLFAESLAALFLMMKGYRILARRYKTPVGEIDLIAKRGRTVAFIEVKARCELSAALESVTPRMKNRIGRAGRYFLSSNPSLSTCDLRFDLIALAPPFYLRHLDNAWQLAA